MRTEGETDEEAGKNELSQEREDNFERKKQKKDRNLPSNIFKYFFSHLYGHPQWRGVVEKLCRGREGVEAEALREKLMGAVRTGQSYIRPVVVQKLCVAGVLSEGESLVFRLLLRQFLLTDLALTLGGMQKYKKKQKLELIKLARKLYQQIISQSY